MAAARAAAVRAEEAREGGLRAEAVWAAAEMAVGPRVEATMAMAAAMAATEATGRHGSRCQWRH